MYAIVEIAGKQFKVEENVYLYVPRMRDVEEGESITFDKVLLVSADEDVTVGTPTVPGASVSAKILGHVKADKVTVFKKKRRKHYRVRNGHRQPYTKVAIESLSLN